MTDKTLLEQKFEVAFLKGRSVENPMVACLITKYVGQDDYSNPNTQAMFEMFKAGAASVVVELPDAREDAWGQWSIVKDDTVEAIVAAGGKVKS